MHFWGGGFQGLGVSNKQHIGVTAAVAAQHVDMSAQRFGRLADEGVFTRLPGGKFDLDACRVAYIRWLRDGRRRLSKSAAASRVQEARAREIEIRTAEREHRLIETDEAIAVVDDVIGRLRAETSGIGARLTRDRELRRAVEKELDDVFSRAADHFVKAASALRARGEAAEAVAEDDA